MVNLWARYFHEFLFSNFSADYFEEKQYYKISKFRIRYLYLQPCDAFSIWEFSYPYSNQGEDYAHHITACPPPRIWKHNGISEIVHSNLFYEKWTILK